MCKGNKLVNDFLVDVRVVTDQPAVIGSSILDKEMIQQVLGSLGPDYYVFCTSLCVLPTLPIFEDLRAKLIQYEVDLVQTSQQEDIYLVMIARSTSKPQFVAPRPNTSQGG